MADKKRFYEVFSTVNRVRLNEDYEQAETDDTLIDNLTDSMITEFSHNSQMFENGVPYIVNFNTSEHGEVRLELNGDSGVVLDRAIEDQLQYIANYVGSVNNNQVTVKVPFIVDVENKYENGRIEFFIRTSHSPREIEVEIGEQNQ